MKWVWDASVAMRFFCVKLPNPKFISNLSKINYFEMNFFKVKWKVFQFFDCMQLLKATCGWTWGPRADDFP
jgi:hypothetical protein